MTNPATTISQNNPILKRNPPITERFQLYEFFHAPSLRYDPKENIQIGENIKPALEQSITSTDKDSIRFSQRLTFNATRNQNAEGNTIQ
ncbi:unnamed protein product [Adineta steineri]|uniref:Uncharacterized protein n=2 Tax=Adineta steineri TaxID=433720 RepID=A0A819IDU5_9BILA|nr:unnamed protein product [Adineta steineri]